MPAPRDMFFESVVRPEHNGWFLVDSLCTRFTYHSREEWMAKVSLGLVTVNGVVAGVESIAHRGDKVVYHVENYSEPEVPTDFDTLYEDDEFMLVAKPAGVPVLHTGHIFYNTFTAIVRRAIHSETATPLHRLDRDTGGIMLFAKDGDTAARFQRHLDRILLKKFYLAVVPGIFPEGVTECELPLREDPTSELRIKMFHSENGKPCHTRFRRLDLVSVEKTEENPSGFVSIVEAELLTGRKHQMRAHLSTLGFPILGDRLYSHEGKYYLKLASGNVLTEEEYKILGAKNQMLYAYRVQILLPYWNEPREFTSLNFPKEMKALIPKELL